MKELKRNFVIPGDGYTDRFYICHAFLDKKTSKVDMLAAWHTCREFVTKDYRTLVSRTLGKNPTLSKDACILVSMGTVSVGSAALSSYKNRFDLIVNFGIKLANLYERRVGWRFTRAYLIPEESSPSRTYLIIGCPKWTASPYLFSMWTLMLRAGISKKIYNAFSQGFYNGDSSINSVELTLRTILSNGQGARTSHEGQIYYTNPYWLFIMRNYREFLSKFSRKEHWDSSSMVSDYVRAEGLYRLVTGKSNFWDMRYHFRDMCINHGISVRG